MPVISYEVLRKKQLALKESANASFSTANENSTPRAERCVPSCVQVGTCGSLPGTCIQLSMPDERRIETAVVNSYKL